VTELIVPFALRGRTGTVRVRIGPNDDPVALGCDLLDRTLPRDAANGFPVCEAALVFDLVGYAAICGWVQLVRSSDASGEFEIDPLSLLRGVDTPFAFFGVKPTLFDAPFRTSRHDLSWSARSFLCAVPDAVMSKSVRPVAAFSWGFSVAHETIEINPATTLDLTAWDEHLPLLRTSFPNWTFEPSDAC
jgi:hypothetical protein